MHLHLPISHCLHLKAKQYSSPHNCNNKLSFQLSCCSPSPHFLNSFPDYYPSLLNIVCKYLLNPSNLIAIKTHFHFVMVDNANLVSINMVIIICVLIKPKQFLKMFQIILNLSLFLISFHF